MARPNVCIPSVYWTWRGIGLAVSVMFAGIASVRAERPSAMKLFPEETVVFVRTANANEFVERVRGTAMGRMIRDPQLKPFVEHLYGSVNNIYAENAEGKLGVSLEELRKNLPKGEAAFGVIARPSGRPAFLLLIDQGDEPSVAERLIDRGLEVAEEKGADFTTEKYGDVEVTIVRDPGNQERMFGVFERENTIVVATDPNVIRNVIYHWDGADPGKPKLVEGNARHEDRADSNGTGPDEDAASDSAENGDEQADEFVPGRTLAENERFVAIVKQCRRPQDPPPHLLVFVDPIELVRTLSGDNGGLQLALSFFPALGLDGLQAMGATVTYAAGQYDDLTQLHVLLDNPRTGVMQLPEFKPGDTDPQNFVPKNVQSYMAFNYGARATFDRLTRLIDQLRSEGATEKFVERRISEPLGIDFPKDVLDNLAGRFTWTIGFDTPASIYGQQHMFAAELADEEAGKESLMKVIAKYPDLFEERQFGNVTYYAIVPERAREKPPEERRANPFLAIMDGYIFLGGSCQQFERCISARDGTIERLVDSDEYTRTRAAIGLETAGTTPVLFSVGRFEESVRQWYDLLQSEKTREYIEEQKETNKFLAALAEAMDANELPPFEVLAPYLGPGGGILYDTDNGYHGISFTLRNDSPAEVTVPQAR
jgi:hypothetical protein